MIKPVSRLHVILFAFTVALSTFAIAGEFRSNKDTKFTDFDEISTPGVTGDGWVDLSTTNNFSGGQSLGKIYANDSDSNINGYRRTLAYTAAGPVVRQFNSTTDPWLTTSRNGDSHCAAILYNNYLTPQGGSPDYIRVVVGGKASTGFRWLATWKSVNSELAWIKSNGNAQVGGIDGPTCTLTNGANYWFVATKIRGSGNNYYLSTYLALESSPATPITSVLTIDNNDTDAGDLEHGWDCSYASNIAYVRRAKSLSGADGSSLLAGHTWYEFDASSDTQVTCRGFLPPYRGVAETYTCTTWYRFASSGLNTAWSSPSSGTALTGTMDSVTDSSPPSDGAWYVRKVTNNLGGTAYSNPVFGRPHSGPPMKLLVIGTSVEQLNPPEAAQNVTQAVGLEIKLKQVLNRRVIVYNLAASGSTSDDWANNGRGFNYLSTAISQANTSGCTDCLIAIGENDGAVTTSTYQSNMQSVVTQLKGVSSIKNYFVRPPVSLTFDSFDATRSQAVIATVRANTQTLKSLTGTTLICPDLFDSISANISSMNVDGVHPNLAQHRYINLRTAADIASVNKTLTVVGGSVASRGGVGVMGL